jgi:hypothetical protein
MKSLATGATCLAVILAVPVAAQETALTRSEVTAIRTKLVTVQTAMGTDPAGYIKESEDFDLPTDFNPAQDGRFWPITSGINMRYTDRGQVESADAIEKAAADFQARYAAALASGNVEVITRMVEEMTQVQNQAAAAAANPAARKDPMQVYVQFNMNPSVAIDPEAVVLEQQGVIALREKELNSNDGSVTVYLDPVVLRDTGDLARFELRTPNEGVTNKTGLYHIVIQAHGSVPDIESWIAGFDFDAMLGVIDPR